MKILFKLFLCSLLFVFSCNTEDIQEEPIQPESMNRQAGLDAGSLTPEEETLENRMQWVSYMTAQTLLESGEARRAFQNELDATGALTTVSFDAIFGDQVIDLSFFNEFRDQFFYYYNQQPGDSNDPCDGNGRPNGSPKPPGTIGGSSNNAIFEFYISSLLTDDCFEFYLPHGFAYLEPVGNQNGFGSPILSTAHPLNFEPSNEGYKHETKCIVSSMDIDDSTPGFIIVVRPYRAGVVCTYDDYLMDFEDFLD